MSDAKFFQRGKLTSEKKDPRYQLKKVAMKKVVANMTMGNDMSPLYKEVIACMGIPDIDVKKMVARAEIANLAVNGFEDDVNDPNPLIRAMAIRTMGYIYVDRVIDSLIDPLRHCLRDRDPYVRKTSAMAVLKLSMFDRSIVEEERFLDMLKDLLADSNPSVVANAVAALTEISERSPHIKLKLNMKIANKLITALNECNEWGQIYILESLIVDAETHGNSGVVLVAIKVINYMMNYVSQKETLEPILRKLSPPLVTLLTSGPEVQYITLRNIQLLLQRWPTILQNQLRAFFCKYDDPIYVKLAKLEVILSLTTEENARIVLTELTEYATEIDVDFVRKAVRSIGRIAIKIELAADRCVRALLDLIQTKVNYVVQEAIIVIRDVFRKYPNRYESIIATLCENLDTLDEPEARAAMIWIIGQYADRIDNSDEVLDKFLDSFLDDPAEVQLALLTAVVKLFIMRPTAGQDLVPKVLKWATEEVDSPDIRDRGFIYWRLLSTDPEMARTIVLSDKPEISAEGEKLDMSLLEELVLQIGSLSSIYRKPPTAFIPFAKRRVLGQSPALTRLTIAAPPVSRLPRTNSSTASQSLSKQTGAQQQQQQQNPQQGSEPSVPTSLRNSSTQLSSSMLDMGSGGMAGLSNPYINDITPGPMLNNDAMLIDLMSMEDEDEAADGGAAINSGGMVGFNANFGMSGLNMAGLNMAGMGSTTNSSQAPDSQVLNSAFDAAGLDALSKMPTSSSSLPRGIGSPSPAPEMMRQFTSSFDLAAAAAAVTAASANSNSHVSGTGSGFTSPFSVPSSMGSSAFTSAFSPTSSGFNALASASSPFDTSSQITPISANPLLNSSFSAAAANPATSTTVSNSAAKNPSANPLSLQKEVDELTAKMFNSSMLNAYSSTTIVTSVSGSSSNGNGDNNGNYSNSGNNNMHAGSQFGNNSSNASMSPAPYVPSQKVLLDAQQTQGLEILGTFARRNGKIQMEMSFVNKSGIAISDFAIQFNKNTYGLMPGAPLSIGTVLPMNSVEVSLPLVTAGPTMLMQPLNNIQIAIKCTAGIFYFQTQYSLHILLEENAQSDQGTFLRMWKSTPDDMQSAHTVQNLRFSSIEDVRNKLNMNNVFTVAQRIVGNAMHFYTNSKLSTDGSLFYSEIKIASNLQLAVISTKSTNTQLIPLYQKAIEDICTAF
ncbi:adaptin N terminal region-domain-containing protein [Coemansia spiralis]|nr:adaptin N terminal region-domain-containing protein [Coemansia spiralis]